MAAKLEIFISLELRHIDQNNSKNKSGVFDRTELKEAAVPGRLRQRPTTENDNVFHGRTRTAYLYRCVWSGITGQ